MSSRRHAALAALIALLGGAAPAQGESLAQAAEVTSAPSALKDQRSRLAATLRDAAQSYEHGEGMLRDPGRAVDLYCAAARLGDVEAQYSLGWMYANARGVARDDAVAAHFFALAASRGDALAQRMLVQVGAPTGEPPPCLRERPTPPVVANEDLAPDAVATPAQRALIRMVRRIAPEYGINPRLAIAVMRSESNFNPAAISPRKAQGLMQLIPETAQRFNVSKPFDPEQNLRGGLAYLRWLLAYFRGDVKLVAAAYNAGEGSVERYRGIPPYPETRDYVQRIRTQFRQDEHPYDPTVTAPSPELPRISARRLL